MNLRATRLPISLIIAGLLSSCAAFTEHSTGLEASRLSECPQWPRCVSSQSAIAEKQIAPFQLVGNPEQAWAAVLKTVVGMPRTTVVTHNPRYLHAEVISPWRVYTDDLELLLQPKAGLIQVRSSGRIGYYDFNVNRDRIEALRQALIQQAVIKG